MAPLSHSKAQDLHGLRLSHSALLSHSEAFRRATVKLKTCLQGVPPPPTPSTHLKDDRIVTVLGQFFIEETEERDDND